MTTFVRVCSLLILSAVFFTFSDVLAQAQSAAAAKTDPQEDPLKRSRPSKKKDESRAYKKWLDEVNPIITPEEEAAFRRLTNDAERQNFIEIFWHQRDPTPDTEENEYKEEFYRRVAYANDRFAAGKPGEKTDRGRIYIIHGPPDSVEAHPAGGPYQRPAEEGGGQTQTHPFEIWRYRNLDGIGQEIEIEFVDPCGCGEYHLTLDRGEKDVMRNIPGAGPTDLEAMQRANKRDRSGRGIEQLGQSLFGGNRESKEFDRIWTMAMVAAPPPIKMGSREDVRSTFRTNLLAFDYRVDFVKAPLDTVTTPITIQIPNSSLMYASKDGVQHASVNVLGRVTTLTGRVVQAFEEPLRLDVAQELLEKFVASSSLYQKSLPLRPGRYKLDLIVKDVNGGKVGWASRTLIVPDFSEERLAASTLILADVVETVAARDIGSGNFVLGDKKVRPRVAIGGAEAVEFQHGQKVSLWMQVYNLGTDAETRTAEVEIQVTNTASGHIVMSTTETANVRDNVATLAKNLTPNVSEPGEYQVLVRVKNGAADTVEKSARFVVK